VNFDEERNPTEIFITIAKRGSIVSGFARTLATIVSVALQYNVPWETLYSKLRGQRFDPMDQNYSSLVDGIADSLNESIKIGENKK